MCHEDRITTPVACTPGVLYLSVVSVRTQVVVGSTSVRRKRGGGAARTFTVLLLTEGPRGERWLRQRWQTAVSAEQLQPVTDAAAATEDGAGAGSTRDTGEAMANRQQKDKKKKKKKRKKKKRSNAAQTKAGEGRAPKIPRTGDSADETKSSKLALLVASLRARAEAGAMTLARAFAQVSSE